MYVSKVENDEIKVNQKPYKHSGDTKSKISQRLKSILSSNEKKEERSEKCRKQHMKARLEKFKNIILDDDLNKYLFPIIKKGTEDIYKYDVRINGIVTTFYDSKSEVSILYNNALNFLKVLKENNNILK